MERSEVLKLLDLPETKISVYRTRPKIELRGRISRSLVEEISRLKGEPEWMLKLRLRSLELFEKLPFSNWLQGIDELDLDELAHYVKPETEIRSSWEEIPEDIRRVYEQLGLPEIEAKILAGLATQYDSENVYLGFKKYLEELGVILMDMSEAVVKYPDLVKRYFMRIFPPSDHKFAALHGALWSGGVFLYVPENVRIEAPIEAFFFVASELESQFEHTLIIADRNSFVHFIEGCAAPIFKRYSFHNGMVEIYVHEGAHVKFTTMQNWGKKMINFNNKRAILERNAKIEWIEGSIGSKASYVYPSTILRGENSRASLISVTFARGKVWKEGGGKMIHLAPNTTSKIVSKSISAEGGISVYRGLVRVSKKAANAVSSVQCDSLILDEKSSAYTYPHNQIENETATITHEATTGRLSEDVLFYLQSRGFTENEARSLVVLGFMEDILGNLPFEYAVVLRRVVELEFGKLGGAG